MAVPVAVDVRGRIGRLCELSMHGDCIEAHGLVNEGNTFEFSGNVGVGEYGYWMEIAWAFP